MINASGGSTPNSTNEKPTNTPPVVPTTGPGFPTHNPAMQHKNLMPGMPNAPVANKPTTPAAPTVNSTGATPPAAPKFPDPTKNLIKATDNKEDTVPGGSDDKKDSTKPKKKLNLKMIIGVVVLLLVVLGSGAGFYLSQQQQDLRQQAYDGGIPGCCKSNSDCPSGEECSVANGACPNGKSCKAPSSTIRSVCRNNACSQQVCVPGSGSKNCTDPTCSTNEECKKDDEEPPTGALCPNPPNLPIVWCATFNCPKGDTTGDGECNVDDDGASYTTGGTSCPNPSSGCGQVDYYSGGTPGQSWDQYCGHTFLKFDKCDGGSEPSSKTISGKTYCELYEPGSPFYLINNVPLKVIDSGGTTLSTPRTSGGNWSLNFKPQKVTTLQLER